MKNFASRHQQDGLWRTQDPFGKAWAKQFNGGPSHAEDILDSLRDVSEDVPYGSRINGVPVVFGKLPENHLFSMLSEAFGTKTEGSNDKGIERLGDDAKPTGTFGDEGACIENIASQFKDFEPPKNKDQGIIGVTNMPYEARCSADPAHISVPKKPETGCFAAILIVISQRYLCVSSVFVGPAILPRLIGILGYNTRKL